MLSPLFELERDDAPKGSRLLVINWHWTASLAKSELADATVLYRVREALINQITANLSSYAARPGIVDFA